jgi:Tctex-1 family
MVTCLIMQKTEVGLVSTTACNFEAGTDMSLHFSWPKEKAKDQANKTMQAVVTVFCARF